jgi:hypothetical protein
VVALAQQIKVLQAAVRSLLTRQVNLKVVVAVVVLVLLVLTVLPIILVTLAVTAAQVWQQPLLAVQ